MPAASPAARCLGCGFSWNSPAMAHGLRAIGGCPKCGGELEFHGEATAPTAAGAEASDHGAPHLALGRPQR
jgi:hypothetical protein